MIDLKNKNIFVTGATGGIGGSIIDTLNVAGANLIASGSNQEKLEMIKSKYKNIKIIKFDISKLKEAYNQVLKIKDFQGVEGVTNFGAISLTQIPGDPDSIKGNKARGVFWTKPDQSGKEVVRDQMIDEAAYSEFISDY